MIFVLISSVLVLSTLHNKKMSTRHTNIKVVTGMLHDLDLRGLDLFGILSYKISFNYRNLSHELVAFQTLKIYRSLRPHS